MEAPATLSPMTLCDGYKLSHRAQYPDGTEYVYSNWTPRGSRIAGVDKVVFLGLQYFIKRYLVDEFDKFFDADEDEVVEAYARRINGYLGPNNVGTDHVRALHRLGYLPLEFLALPEGTSVPLRVPMLTVENTLPEFFWLVNYIESLMSCVLWMPSTTATIAKRMRGLLEDYAVRTGSPVEFVDWQGHDFSFRGMAGVEAAILSGMGHLTQFTGTDTIPAIDAIEQYYPTDSFIGGSVPATEHSVMCAGGKSDELETFRRLLGIYPAGILSVVSDTWDLWKVLTEIVPQLHSEIMSRDGKLVIRPDSGDPADILCGTNPLGGTPSERGVIQLLWDEFGGSVTETGHKLLDSHIGVIYGDAITYDKAGEIMERLTNQGFASANVVFGMGSYGYQYQTRDTFGFAMKATNVVIDGDEIQIFKDPVTDSGTKKSLRGRIAVVLDENGQLVAKDEVPYDIPTEGDLLQPVWSNGMFLRTQTFDDVRSRARE